MDIIRNDLGTVIANYHRRLFVRNNKISNNVILLYNGNSKRQAIDEHESQIGKASILDDSISTVLNLAFLAVISCKTTDSTYSL